MAKDFTEQKRAFGAIVIHRVGAIKVITVLWCIKITVIGKSWSVGV